MELAWLNRAWQNYILLQHFRSFETTFIFGQTRRTVKSKKNKKKQVCIIMQTKLQKTGRTISMWQKKKNSYKYRLV